jgi:hypothetical protein
MQQENGKSEPPKRERPFDGPVIQAIVTQIIFYVAASIRIRDMGEVAEACNIASIPFWIVVVLRIFRNPKPPSRLTLLFIRWGLILIIPLGAPVAYPYAQVLNKEWRAQR